jgi:hypothetical protein
MATAHITLTQFEQIDGLFNACLRRPEIEAVMAHPLASRDYVQNVYFRPEWQLMDACVGVLGVEATNNFASAVDCAAHLLTDCLLGKVEVVDVEAFA